MALVVGTGAAGALGERSWGAALLVAIGLALAGLSTAVLASLPWPQVAAHLAARGWPAAEARIGSVGLAETAAQDGVRRLALTVSYAYEVDDAAYEGGRASLFDEAARDDRRLKGLYARLNFARVTGTPVPVFHHPDEPAIALLDRALPWRRVLPGGGAALALLATGLGFLAAAFRRPRAS